jgi:hypothetical protein
MLVTKAFVICWRSGDLDAYLRTSYQAGWGPAQVWSVQP